VLGSNPDPVSVMTVPPNSSAYEAGPAEVETDVIFGVGT
jgi:hypothetical protein